MDRQTKDKETRGQRGKRTKQQSDNRDKGTKERRDNGPRGWKLLFCLLRDKETKG